MCVAHALLLLPFALTVQHRQIVLRRRVFDESIDRILCRYKKLGKMKYEEYVVAFGFVLLSILWLFRVDLNFGDSFSIPGFRS